MRDCIRWFKCKLKPPKKNRIPLKETVTVPLKDKLRLRNIFDGDFHAMFMVKQGDTWYNLKHKTNQEC